jgi:hypothetical protein
MGLGSFGLEIGIFCDFLYSVLLFDATSGLDFSGRALSWPQVWQFAFPGTSAGSVDPWHCELVAALRTTTAGPGRGGGEGLQVLTTVLIRRVV